MNKRDQVFANTAARISDFAFDAQIASVFDDMLVRSVPFYIELQRMIVDICGSMLREQALVLDLGCATANTLLALEHRYADRGFRYLGIDSSPPMLHIARQRIAEAGLESRATVLEADLNALPPIDPLSCDATIASLTLQFLRPLQRDAVVRNVHRLLKPGGLFIVVEKVLAMDPALNRLFIELHQSFKRRNGYSEIECARKREALENVLVPFRTDENIELLSRNGFPSAELFVQWFNFVGIVAQKRETGEHPEVIANT